jgi:hypothetical protein
MEHEITGHTRKIYTITKNKTMSFWKKVKEIVIEIAIIVFAVSLAAFLERSREHSHEQEAVKEFLAGLKTDLQSDITEMSSDKESYYGSGQAFSYLASVKKEKLFNNDSLKKYQHYINNETGLIVNNGRFEGFKSSGRIITIENQDLQNDILDLYQEDIVNLLNATNYYTKRKEYLFQFVTDNLKRITDSTDNFTALMASEKGHNICQTLAFTRPIIDLYDSTINKSKKIIAAIDKSNQ